MKNFCSLHRMSLNSNNSVYSCNTGLSNSIQNCIRSFRREESCNSHIFIGHYKTCNRNFCIAKGNVRSRNPFWEVFTFRCISGFNVYWKIRSRSTLCTTWYIMISNYLLSRKSIYTFITFNTAIPFWTLISIESSCRYTQSGIFSIRATEYLLTG